MSSVTCVAGQPNCDTHVERSAPPMPQETAPATVAADQPSATAAGSAATTVGVVEDQPTAAITPVAATTVALI